MHAPPEYHAQRGDTRGGNCADSPGLSATSPPLTGPRASHPPAARHGGPPQHGPESGVDQRVAFCKRAPRRDDGIELRRQRGRRKAHDAVDAALDAGSRNDSPRCCTYGAMTRYGLFVFVLCFCVRVSSGTTRDFGACSNVRAERGQYRECPSVWCVSADANTILRNIYCVRDTNASPMVQWSDRACVMLVCHPDPLSGYPDIGSSHFSHQGNHTLYSYILRDSHEIRRGTHATPKNGRWRIQVTTRSTSQTWTSTHQRRLVFVVFI